MNSSDCCTNKLEFRICTSCKNIHYKVYGLLTAGSNVNVTPNYQTSAKFVIFTINEFITVYYHFSTLDTSVLTK